MGLAAVALLLVAGVWWGVNRLPAAAATPQPAAGTIREIQGIPFVYVPAGEFVMGSADSQGNDDEHPQHSVYLHGYWIMQTEVTNAQYAKCVAAGACIAPYGSVWQEAGRAQEPVTYVDWERAQVFARWLGGVLPTEAQWEKACRGVDGRVYPWGNTFDATILNDNTSGMADVGSYPQGASPYGVLDMAGGVWEWTNDWYGKDYYGESPAENPFGSGSGEYRVLRGGAPSIYEDDARCAYRGRLNPGDGRSLVGFRVASPSS